MRSCFNWIKQHKKAEEAYVHRLCQFEIAENRSFTQTDFAVSSLTQENSVNTAQSIDSDDFILT